MRFKHFSGKSIGTLFEQRSLKASSRAHLPLSRGAHTGTLWGYIFLPDLNPNSLFAARTLAQALSEHVLRPHLTVLLVSLQHTLRYFGSWDAMARVYHAQVQHLAPGVRPRLLLSHHLFAGLHFGLHHPETEFGVADSNNLVFRNHLSALGWAEWREACLLFASLLQLKNTELQELVRSVSQFSEAAQKMRFQSPAHFPHDLQNDDIARRFGRWAVLFWEMWSRPELSLGTVFKDLPQDLCAQDFITTSEDCDDFRNEPSYPLSTLPAMLESVFRKLLDKVSAYNSLERAFGIRDFKLTLEIENSLKIQQSCLLNEPVMEFNKTTRLLLDNLLAKLPHKGQEFQHPNEPSFYFKAFQIYRLTLEPLRITPCTLSASSALHTQRAPLPLERIIQNLELKHAGEAFQVPLHASFSSASSPQKNTTELVEAAEKLQHLNKKKMSQHAPSCLFRYAVQERPLHLVKEKIEFSLSDFFAAREAPVHHLEYLESIDNEDLYALHAPSLPALLLSCAAGSAPAEARFELKGIYEPRGSSLQERLF